MHIAWRCGSTLLRRLFSARHARSAIRFMFSSCRPYSRAPCAGRQPFLPLALAILISGSGPVIGVGLVIAHPDPSSIFIGLLIGEIASTALFPYYVVKTTPAVKPLIYRSLIVGVIVAATMVGGLSFLPEPSLANRLILAIALMPSVALILPGLFQYWKDREATGAPKRFLQSRYEVQLGG